MEWKFKRQIMQVGNSLVIIIPKPIIDNYKIKKGDNFEIRADEHGLYIKAVQKK